MIDHDELFGELDRQRESGTLAKEIREENHGITYGSHKDHPGKLIRTNADGTHTIGVWKNGEFTPDEIRNDL